MSTLKVDTLDTRTGSGNITVNRPLSGSGANLTALNGSNISSGTVAAARLPALGKVLQVVQTHDTTGRSQSISAATTANISGLNATITPSATTSKILVSVRWNGEGSVSDLQDSVFGINRDSTEIGAAAHAGNRQGGIATISMGYYLSEVTTTPDNCYYEYLDSPSSTSAITYHGTVSPKTAMTLYTNRSVNDTNANWVERVTSTITLWEIGA
tara:strand:- start:294 stop:932 length:639 start_codon:yes stop_codon:yes gene_type:complete